jgi:hypothetical protein
MDRRKGEHAVFLAATDPELVRPVFKLVWKPLLTALAAALAGPAEPAVVRLALPVSEPDCLCVNVACGVCSGCFSQAQGLLSLIHVACVCGFKEARNSLVKVRAVRTTSCLNGAVTVPVSLSDS